MNPTQTMALFIDGGYLYSLLKTRFGEPRLDYATLAEWASGAFSIFRVYYYDALPYMPSNPTEVDQQRYDNKKRFLTALDSLPRFMIRQGRLAFRGYDKRNQPILAQKRVDLQMGLDIATVVTRGSVTAIGILSGDSDFVPAVNLAKDNSVLVRHIHGPRGTYSEDLWRLSDERLEMTEATIKLVLR